eukprot:TRINITY_DN9799_c0_g1_i1.p1 TRINITY_DN9799_c0_g1~~TRINITY_DN9799_c0_g1_i1.p1  ORF type:complete len:509 (-),score=98.74 TRINITY_DN9799_c0_g1_i1:2-1528(-)
MHHLFIAVVLLASSVYCTNLNVNAIAYFDGDLKSVDITPSGYVVLVGSGTETYSSTPVDISAVGTVGNGRIIFIQGSTGNVYKVYRIGDKVSDVAVHSPTNSIVAVGQSSTGYFLVALAGDGSSSTPLWYKSALNAGPTANLAAEARSDGLRVAVGLDGRVMAKIRARNHFFRVTDGTGYGSTGVSYVDFWTYNGDKSSSNSLIGGYNIRQEDIVVDSSSKTVILFGWSQRCSNYISAWIAAYSYANGSLDQAVSNPTPVWKDYNWWCSALTSGAYGGDFFVYRGIIGEDSQIYYLGSGNGANQFLRTPSSSSSTITTPVANTQFDRYTQTDNLGSAKMGYYAQLSGSGIWLKGQTFVARESTAANSKAATFNAYDIAVLDSGSVLVGGSSTAYHPDRSNSFVNGVALGSYSGSDAYVQEHNWNSRSVSTSFSNNGRVTGVAGKFGLRAAIGVVNSNLVTATSPRSSRPSTNSTCFFAVWGTYSSPPPTTGFNSSSVNSGKQHLLTSH